MPKYEYKCPCCNVVVVVFCGMNETPDLKCVKCNEQVKMIRIPSVNNLVNVG